LFSAATGVMKRVGCMIGLLGSQACVNMRPCLGDRVKRCTPSVRLSVCPSGLCYLRRCYLLLLLSK